MLLIFLDSEMSGLNPRKHRLLEIAFVVVDSITGERLISYESIIAQPQEIWAESDPESLRINGFTWEKCLKGKPEKVVEAEIIQSLNHLDLGEKSGVFICQNPSADRCFFSQLVSVELQEEFGWPYHWLDLASMFWALRLMEDQKETRQMRESHLSKNRIANFYGVPPEKEPHSAMRGVLHLMDCYNAMFGNTATTA